MSVYPTLSPSLPSYSSTMGNLAFMGQRVSSSIYAQQGLALLQIRLGTFVPTCVLLGWWFRLWKVCLVDIFVSMRLQTPSVLWIFSLTPPLRTLCSVQWLAKSVPLWICQNLAESLRILVILTDVRWNLRVVFIWNSLITEYVEHFFRCFSAIEIPQLRILCVAPYSIFNKFISFSVQ